MTAKEFSELYADLAAVGGVANALQLSLRSCGSPLVVTGKGIARVEKERRFSQVYTASEVRLFIFDFWDRGINLGNAETPDLLDVAKSIHAWVEDKVKMSHLQTSFAFVVPEEIAEPFESDREVEWKWARLEEACRQRDMSDLLPLVTAARKRSELRCLFPFTSHATLCLSRCTGYPYSGDCPSAWPTKKKGRYEVYGRDGKVVGQGDAEQAVRLLVENLPSGCGPAQKGTAKDL